MHEIFGKIHALDHLLDHFKTNNMTQQTAVEWLKDRLKKTYDKEGKLPLAYTLHLVEQAKQMEKQQIIDAHIEGQPFATCISHKAEQYYNETYKTK